MIIKTTISPLWLAPAGALQAAAAEAEAILQDAPPQTQLIFRADDIGAPGDNCREMMTLFRKHAVPLHMAVTPAWLSAARWATLREWAGDADCFIWHQHGWRHQNHQQSGKKGEFGTDRPKTAKAADLAKGRTKLEALMGEDFTPVFTPPWNRVDAETAEALAEQDYVAISRSGGEERKVPMPESVPDIPVNVDLHTRKETVPEAGLAALLDELREAVASGRIGFMLHHQRMNKAAFSFLDELLSAVARNTALRLLRMNRL